MAQPLFPQEKPFAIAPARDPTPDRPTVPSLAEDRLHELRVRIPVDLHRQLLSLKILRGKSLAETVAVALDLYFAEQPGGATAAQP